jgi:hypothetical protein
MEPDDLLCSRNARSSLDSAGTLSLSKGGLSSLGLMTRLGVPVGGRVRNLRAVKDQSAPIPREKTSKLGGSIYIVRCAQSRIDQATLTLLAEFLNSLLECAATILRHPKGPL